MSDKRALVLRGQPISEDGAGNICLDDLWTLAKGKESKAPKNWKRSRGAKALIEELQRQVTNSNLRGEKAFGSVIYEKTGTYAHPILAAAYAGHLSPKLEIEVREVWLRYRAGDATLADEILQRATSEANLWAGTRAIGRAQRVSYTDVLKAHGVEGRGYMACTEAVYQRLFDSKAYELRNRRGMPAKANVRDHLERSELLYVGSAEALASERIEDEDAQGNAECVFATAKSASAIRRAIEEDRRTRHPRLRRGNDTL